MGVNTLTNRSSRFSSPGNRPSRHNDNHDDDVSVRSHSGPPAFSAWYVLPCFRFRNKSSAALATLATVAIFVTVCSAFIACQFLSSISPSAGHFILPSARKWAASREYRKNARQERRASSPNSAQVKAVKYSEYETNLLNYLFTLRAQAVKAAMLPLHHHAPIGQDMGIYTNLGCSVFNQLNVDQNSLRHISKISPKDQIRQLWSSHLSSILAASRHADDPDYSHKSWTKTLLQYLSPSSILDHLPKGNNSDQAMTTKDIERIIGILVRRFLGLLQNNAIPSSNTPPPLRIAVFGGPTVEGLGCHRARVGLPPGSIMANPAFCAFPYRLEQFLNAILLPPSVLKQVRRTLQGVKPGGVVSGDDFRLVEVISLGEEGTSSEFSNAIIRNRMYPPLANNQVDSSATGYGGGPPDMVIDAYGIDDYGDGSTELHSIYEVLSQPSRVYPKGCFRENRKPPPVIIRAVLEDDGVTSSEWQVASSIMTAVLGDAVDDVEEGDMSLPDIQNPESKETEAGGAFGMAGHIASSWTLGFNLAHAAISHCGSVQQVAPKMRKPIPDFSDRCDNGIDPPCTFSFLAGLKGTATRPAAIASSLMPFIVENTGWQPESDISTGFARKTGLVGTGAGATMTLLFRNITRPIRRFDVITLRSTSDAWKDGSVQFVLVTGGDFSHGDEAAEESSKLAKETSFEVSAELIADKSNGEDRHISYHFGIDLAEDNKAGELGTDVLLRIILTNGSRFKILGLMLCE